MKSVTKPQYMQVLTWLIWAIVLLIFTRAPESSLDTLVSERSALAGVITPHWRDGPLFPWKYCLRVVIRRQRRVLQRTRHCVAWGSCLVRLALRRALTMAQVVDWLTQAQLRRHLGALPVLYGLLEVLQVRQIINRHCSMAAEVDHGAVALVLILNRLVAPRPLLPCGRLAGTTWRWSSMT